MNMDNNHSAVGSVTHNDTTGFPNIAVINVPASSESERVFIEPGNTFLKQEVDGLLGCIDDESLRREVLRRLEMDEKFFDGPSLWLLLRQLKTNGNFSIFLDDAWLLSELVKRSKTKLSAFIESRMHSGRIHFMQSIKIMSKQRLAEFRAIGKLFIQAAIKVFHPVEEDSLTDILKDIFGLQSVSNIHIEHSKAIIESIRFWSPKERIVQMAYLTKEARASMLSVDE
jgi:hypothetical protein